MSINLNLITLLKKNINYQFVRNKFYYFHYTQPLQTMERVNARIGGQDIHFFVKGH